MKLAPRMIAGPAVALLAAGMLAGCGDTDEADDTMEPTATHDEMMEDDSMEDDSMEDDSMEEDDEMMEEDSDS